MATLLRELRQALRGLARDRSFTLAALATLALALGATTVIWSLADAVILRPLPYPASARLVSVGNDWAGAFAFDHASQSLLEMGDVATLEEIFDQVAAYRSQSYNFTAGEGEPVRIESVAATGAFFDILQVPASLGRAFGASDDPEERVVVLSHALWQRRFGGDGGILGRRVRLGSEVHEVIGVMPSEFRFPDSRAELWVSEDMTQSWAQVRGWRSFRTIARLHGGVPIELAATELDRLASHLREEHAGTYADPRLGWRMSLRTLHQQIVGESRAGLLLLLGAVGFVTLIACTNVANLLLARAVRRKQELSLRAALGASSGALLRQLACEGVVLTAMAALLGWVLARASLGALLLLVPSEVPRISEVDLDARVFLFVAALASVTGLGIGLATFFGVRRSAVAESLGRRDGRAFPRRLRHGFVAAQTALALVLLAAAGLMLRSLEQLQRVDPGFRSDDVWVARVVLDAGRYPDDPARIRFFDDLLLRLRGLPEVRSAGAVSSLPLRDGTGDWAVAITGSSVAAQDEAQFEQSRFATEDYFETMGIPVLMGRGFAAADTSDATPVAVISASFAQRYWPDRSPLGQTIRPGGPDSSEPPRMVVGVVGDVKHEALHDSPRPTFYLPARQDPSASMTLAVRGRDSHDLVGSLRRELAAIDPEQALDRAQPLAGVVAAASGDARFQVRVIGSFALLALLLAAIGTYGVVAYVVEQERRAFGIRLALGARRGEVAGLVLRRAAVVAGTGLACGLALIAATARLLRRFLFEISPADPATLAAVTLALFATALLAAWLPARRAARVDPIVALRAD
ncbi:MAG TPA: ABC transporter permease [Thermoanaerobaculia bacterium]|nr:ABC transporter permease [Thermoanaerobaculia bacterium]